MSYKNVFGSFTMVTGIKFKPFVKTIITLGTYYDKQFILLPYANLINGKKLTPKNYGYVEDDLGTKTYHRYKIINNGPTNIGFTMGIDVPVHRFIFGLHYYQRFYFTGFNREISRIMLRVGF